MPPRRRSRASASCKSGILIPPRLT
jgi:hypothetical protein